MSIIPVWPESLCRRRRSRTSLPNDLHPFASTHPPPAATQSRVSLRTKKNRVHHIRSFHKIHVNHIPHILVLFAVVALGLQEPFMRTNQLIATPPLQTGQSRANRPDTALGGLWESSVQIAVSVTQAKMLNHIWGGGVEKHLECRSTVSRGHFRTGTHGHLHLSHFLHDPDTFIEVRGRAARTRRNGSPGRTTPSRAGSDPRGRVGRSHDPNGVGVLPPRSHSHGD